MASMMTNKTVGEWVAERPGRSKIFERYGIDYCCGGKKPLLEACLEKGVSVNEVLTALERASVDTEPQEALDWSTATLSEMVAHIMDVHHAYLYQALPRLSEMARKVARVHGEKDARLAEMSTLVTELHAELIDHMAKEERVLFPYCQALQESGGTAVFHCGHIGNPIRVMEMEHEEAGRMLVRLRALTDDYTPPEWACNTYRALLDGLREMEADLHRHIHEENNILFPRALAASI